MKTSKKGIELIKKFEGCRLKAYKAMPHERYFTIGYGHYGADVKSDMTITKKQAEQLLINDLCVYENRVYKYFHRYEFNQNEFDALVSFAYNVGGIDALTAEGTRTKAEIYQCMKLYVKSGGKTLQGLVKRRNAECELFITPINLDVDYKELKTVVHDVLFGKYGNGAERKKKLTECGYDVDIVQTLVNKEHALYASLATQVWFGLWGNGKERKEKIEKSGYNYELLCKYVNDVRW